MSEQGVLLSFQCLVGSRSIREHATESFPRFSVIFRKQQNIFLNSVIYILDKSLNFNTVFQITLIHVRAEHKTVFIGWCQVSNILGTTSMWQSFTLNAIINHMEWIKNSFSKVTFIVSSKIHRMFHKLCITTGNTQN